jgi:hypothetical protein
MASTSPNGTSFESDVTKRLVVRVFIVKSGVVTGDWNRVIARFERHDSNCVVSVRIEPLGRIMRLSWIPAIK